MKRRLTRLQVLCFFPLQAAKNFSPSFTVRETSAKNSYPGFTVHETVFIVYEIEFNFVREAV